LIALTMMTQLWRRADSGLQSFGNEARRMGNSARGEVVVITGASAGVGRATARAFALRGARLGLFARGRAGLEAAAAEVNAAGGRALVVPLDIADAAAVDSAAARVEQALGPIDIWINNAMVSVFSPVHEMRVEEYRRVIDATYLGYVHGTLAALRRMRPRDRGVIVQVGSALAYRSIPLQSAYCAAKHAVQGFTDSLRCELAHDRSRVRVTSVHLPALNTPQFTWVKSRLARRPRPVPPIFQPEVAARAILHAAHHGPRELLVGLPTFLAVFGQRLVPGLAERYLARMGYDVQQYDGPDDPARLTNLWEPLPGDYGAHGEFDEGARDASLQLEARLNRGALAAAAAGTFAVAAGVLIHACGKGMPTAPVPTARTPPLQLG
jgi:NAD(P)-dependent dehydrogenase (short-subunit alcohol dehydrogenase family)